ncbi:MAG TPA: thioesterase family protein [Trueperaceae bacterium]|nr:thioesterase family protein [Trueperaceae bacterium]
MSTRPLGPRDPLRTGPKDTVTVVRARFAETDQMGVVHHSVYPVWFEAGRVEWMRERGLSYREMEASGLSLAVARLEVVYRSAAYFDDEIAVVSTLESARSRSVAFAYRLHRVPDGALVATGRTEHVPTDRSGRAVRLPARWLAGLVTTAEEGS